MKDFDLEVEFNQVAVYEAGLEDPFNEWEPESIAQGFAWRPESVCFDVPVDGSCPVRVALVPAFEPDPAALRVIRVPFRVGSGRVEIGSLSSGTLLDLPAGEFSLHFSMLADGSLRFDFSKGGSEPALLRVEDERDIPARYHMAAKPAL